MTRIFTIVTVALVLLLSGSNVNAGGDESSEDIFLEPPPPPRSQHEIKPKPALSSHPQTALGKPNQETVIRINPGVITPVILSNIHPNIVICNEGFGKDINLSDNRGLHAKFISEKHATLEYTLINTPKGLQEATIDSTILIPCGGNLYQITATPSHDLKSQTIVLQPLKWSEIEKNRKRYKNTPIKVTIVDAIRLIVADNEPPSFNVAYARDPYNLMGRTFYLRKTVDIEGSGIIIRELETTEKEEPLKIEDFLNEEFFRRGLRTDPLATSILRRDRVTKIYLVDRKNPY